MKNKGNTQVASLEEAQKLIEELQGKLMVAESDNKSDSKIQLDELIPVMSLLPYNLNLSTKQGGTGTLKKFTRFGEVKKILYSDLLNIMDVNSAFLEAGFFYILHPALLRHHGLEETYSKILTKEKIEAIIGANSDEVITLYETANSKQQEIIIEFLVDRLKENPDSVNLNVVDKLSRVSKVDIMKKVDSAKELDELVADKK